MKEKQKKLEKLFEELGNCNQCLSFPNLNKSLINIYQNLDFSVNIPSIWTDWFHRVDSSIMIIGQDWGPYQEMKTLHDKLNYDKSNWKDLIESEKSNTKKLLAYYIEQSSQGTYTLDDLFVTNAILCARKGNSYRGDNIDLKKSTLNCSKYLLRQIEIVKPKVIVTLGYYPLLSLASIFGFPISKTLKETIQCYPEIKVYDFVIIPVYHPVAQIKKEEQLKQYQKIWKYV
jgi:uracil-DNA glycosylase family 4